MTIDEITDKIIENKNNDIAKAFTMHIGSLLLNNGIVPVMTEYTGNDVKNITDTNEYKLVMEYGIAFKELDCSKHDKEIYNKAIDEFAEKLSNECFEQSMTVVFENRVRADVLTLDGVTEIIFEIAEQLKTGGIDGNERTDT